jgi:hypothetical protein
MTLACVLIDIMTILSFAINVFQANDLEKESIIVLNTRTHTLYKEKGVKICGGEKKRQ